MRFALLSLCLLFLSVKAIPTHGMARLPAEVRDQITQELSHHDLFALCRTSTCMRTVAQRELLRRFRAHPDFMILYLCRFMDRSRMRALMEQSLAAPLQNGVHDVLLFEVLDLPPEQLPLPSLHTDLLHRTFAKEAGPPDDYRAIRAAPTCFHNHKEPANATRASFHAKWERVAVYLTALILLQRDVYLGDHLQNYDVAHHLLTKYPNVFSEMADDWLIQGHWCFADELPSLKTSYSGQDSLQAVWARYIRIHRANALQDPFLSYSLSGRLLKDLMAAFYRDLRPRPKVVPTALPTRGRWSRLLSKFPVHRGK